MEIKKGTFSHRDFNFYQKETKRFDRMLISGRQRTNVSMSFLVSHKALFFHSKHKLLLLTQIIL